MANFVMPKMTSMNKILLASFALFGSVILSAQPQQAYKGWPGHDDISDLKGCFANPPKGYGNVPFYWWTGDPLDMKRLEEQLDILAAASTDGLCVSYNHTDARVDLELNAAGHGNCGVVCGGDPRVMSEEWFSIWNEFSARCAEKGVGVGMDDYVLAWPKNRDFMDSVILAPRIREYQGQLKTVKVPSKVKKPQNALTVLEKGKDSTTYICTEPAPWLHPEIGQEWIAKYFQKFADHMDAAGLQGMNYFFQDELQYHLNLRSWSEDMPKEFKARKGYDIVPLLPALFLEDADKVDAQAAKVRLDYAEVLTQLSEERFFKPIYDWNASKGLIYGCDNEGRGLRPLQYLDYFRATSWFTAPGNDAPSRGSSFRQTKVSSSIAHLYGRPRTWLEAFHSIGWDANGALLKSQLDHHIIAGGNLLCMHGLYYSTHGGWWEWAPPCFHFRMPYWDHMKLWLKYAERMCFLLSQGTHVCDIAILYPTETMQAIPGTDQWSTFGVSEVLSKNGLDYDFIDYQSIWKSAINGASLDVAGESYKVLVLADTRALHAETLGKILAFKRAGGIVITVGSVMPELHDAGVIELGTAAEVPSKVRSLTRNDFFCEAGEGKVLHRRIGERDVYMVMDVEKGSKMYFRARGLAEVWDAMDGSCRPLPVIETDTDGSWVRYDGETGGSMLVVFSPGEPVMGDIDLDVKPVAEQPVNGSWNVTLVPTMNNRWGDFRLPASDEMIGAEAREIRYFTDIDSVNWKNIPCDIYGYGPHMLACTVDATEDIDKVIADGTGDWKPYSWSWQYGVFDSPGSQGYHGLKGKVDPRFLILDQGGHQLFRTNVYVPKNGKYQVFVEGVEPSRLLIDGSAVKAGELRLKAGWHSLLIAYANTARKDYDLSRLRGDTIDDRDRSMVMFYPAGVPEPADRGLYDEIVASRWYGTEFLTYDVDARPTHTFMQFETAPGTCGMNFKVNGKVESVKVDGKEAAFTAADGSVNVRIADVNPGVSTVTVACVTDEGFPGGAFFETPVKMECSGGRMPEGDWTEFGALGYYSGGIRYEKDIEVGEAESVVLDLGEVDATCELTVNGQFVKALISKPYSADITEFVKPGRNHVEVLVYSTLANHYRTIPTPYRGKAHAGLIGPVRVLYY